MMGGSSKKEPDLTDDKIQVNDRAGSREIDRGGQVTPEQAASVQSSDGASLMAKSPTAGAGRKRPSNLGAY